MKKLLYRCPSCGKRAVDVNHSADGKNDEIFCAKCGFRKMLSRQEFGEYHDADPQVQKTRSAVKKSMARRGIQIIE